MYSEKVRNKHEKKRKTWPWIACGIIISLLLGTTWLLFTHSKAYQATEVDDPERVSEYLTHYLSQELYNKSQLDSPFKLEIDQFKLNEAISNPEWWPQSYGDFSLSDPMVVFGDGIIYLMGQLQYQDFVTVLTLELAPTFSGDKLCLNIQSIRLGQLPTKFIVMTIAQQTVDAYKSEIEEDGMKIDVVEAIVKNGEFDPIVYPFDRPLRIKQLSSKEGKLTVTFEPIHEKQ